jgi:hypothetical protein
MCFFTALVFSLSLVLYQEANSVPAKASPADWFQYLLQTVTDSAGEAVEITTDPMLGLALSGTGVMDGMRFSSQSDYNTFITGFWQWMEKNYPPLMVNWSSLWSETTKAGKITLMMQPAMLFYVSQYCISLRGKVTPYFATGNLITGMNVPFQVPGGDHSGGNNCDPQITVMSLNANSTYTINMTDWSISYDQQFTSSNSLGTINLWSSSASWWNGLASISWNSTLNKFTATTNISLVTSTNSIVVSGSSNYTITGITFPYIAQLKVSSYPPKVNNIYPTMTMMSSGSTYGMNVSGNAAGVAVDGSIQTNSIDPSKPVGWEMPANSVSTIPSTTVVGQTAATIGTAVSDAGADVANPADTTTAPTTTTPDWTAPKTGKLDFGPLTAVLSDRFPFCIPFDIIGGISTLVAPSQAPNVTWDLGSTFGHGVHGTVSVLNFNGLDTYVNILRWFLGLFWTYFLILKTRDLVRG